MIYIPGKIPIRIFPFFWLLIAMIGWLNSQSVIGTAIWAGVIFISVLIHEYGHALTAVAFGQEAEIHLVGLGGLTKREGPELAKWKDFIIVLNGPLAGLALYFIASYFAPAAGKMTLSNYAIQITAAVNLFWTILNLLPVLPLDGGQLLRITLEGMLGHKGLKISLLASIVLAALLSFYFFIEQQLLIGALFLMFAFESYRAFDEISHLTGEDANAGLQNTLEEAIEEMRMGHKKEAMEKFVHLREQTKKGRIYIQATHYMALLLAQDGHHLEAYEWLMPIRKHLPVKDLLVLQQLAYRLQEWGDAAKVGQEAYQKEHTPEAAVFTALSFAQLGQAKPAVGWLRSAAQSGYQPMRSLIERKEFDGIRGSSEFQAFIRSF